MDGFNDMGYSGWALALPTLLLQAEFDPLADTDAHARFFAKISNPNK
jgi:alpha-beta hydrolase superfamily lysophospholipase